MRKTFRAFLLEQEQDYVYYVRSVCNIHEEELKGQVDLALLPYGLVELEQNTFKPQSNHNKHFPDHPDTPTYTLKATMSQRIDPETVKQSLATYMKVDPSKIKVEPEGKEEQEETEVEDPSENEFTDKMAQAEVGDNRVGDLLKDIEKDRKEREELTQQQDVYEEYAATHSAVSEALGRNVKKGFYLVEHTQAEPEKGKISGPFKNAPMNLDLVHTLKGQVELVQEGEIENLKVYEIRTGHEEPEYKKGFQDNVIPQMIEPDRQPWEVEVYDQDSGKTFNMVVRAGSATAARNKALTQASREHDVDESKLIVMKPEGESHRVN